MRTGEIKAAKAGAESTPAVDRWENDGGSMARGPGGTSGRPDELISSAHRRILQRLGLAVLNEWNGLPVDVQRKLFKAASEYGASPSAEITERIARFLHDHKDDIGSP